MEQRLGSVHARILVSPTYKGNMTMPDHAKRSNVNKVYKKSMSYRKITRNLLVTYPANFPRSARLSQILTSVMMQLYVGIGCIHRANDSICVQLHQI